MGDFWKFEPDKVCAFGKACGRWQTLLLIIPAMGAILGFRFKAFVLAPATLFVSAITIAVWIAEYRYDASLVILSLFADLALLQIGYFCVLHAQLMIRGKARQRRPVWSPTHFH